MKKPAKKSDEKALSKAKSKQAYGVGRVWTDKIAQHKHTPVANLFLDNYSKMGLNHTLHSGHGSWLGADV